MDFKLLLETIMDLDKNIRFSLVCDLFGNVVDSKHRKDEENYLSEDETKDTLLYSAESWRVRNEHGKKIGRGKFAFVEYDKICRLTLPLGENRLLLVTADNKGNFFKMIEPIMNRISNPK